jgi:hypothetical protein
MHPTLTPETLLTRLDAIAEALRVSDHALALIGLGSVGLERTRLDQYSDLDFFVIVEPGYKARYVDRLDWLAAAQPLSWHYRNTADGHKALMADGVFCEFAVFEPQELDGIPFAPGRVVWRRPDVDAAIATPRRALPQILSRDETWIVGETLGHLFVGLKRWQRGEWLSAARLIQVHAVDRLIELDELRRSNTDRSAAMDPFSPDRRLEQRAQELAAELPALMPGYQHSPAAATAVLTALERRGAMLDEFLTDRIREMAAG